MPLTLPHEGACGRKTQQYNPRSHTVGQLGDSQLLAIKTVKTNQVLQVYLETLIPQ